MIKATKKKKVLTGYRYRFNFMIFSYKNVNQYKLTEKLRMRVSLSDLK